jgi:hypothetical protein
LGRLKKATLTKTSNRPRENYKKVEFLLKLTLNVDNFHGDAIDDLDKFKQWVTNSFTEWDDSILEYFLYSYGLLQNAEDNKYFLDFKVENLLKDDTQNELRPMVEDALNDESKNNKKDKENKKSPDNKETK